MKKEKIKKSGRYLGGILSGCVLTLLLALLIAIPASGDYPDDTTTQPPQGVKPNQPNYNELDERAVVQNAPIWRTYKDFDAWWGENRDHATLLALGKAQGYDYFVHPMSALQAGIPSGTAVVLLTSNSNGWASTTNAQNNPTAQANLISFLQAGGVVIVDMGDNDVYDGYRAPGSVGTPDYIFPSPCSDATLDPAAVAANHPIIVGPDGIPGTADDLNNSNIDIAYSCSVAHGNLTDGITLPPDATVIMTANFGGVQKPILAEYCYEGGRVILETVTKEWVAHQPPGYGYTNLMRNLFSYALSPDAPCTPPLSEISSSDSTLFETLSSKIALLNNVQVSGDFNSTLNFTNFEIVSITTGPFAGKGFSKGEFETTLEGILYQGQWKGALFLKPQETKIYLRGAVTGQISATVEGYLTESASGSGIYDRYQATWKIGRLGMTTTSATIKLNGNLSYQSDSEFPATQLYILQTNIEGDISGHYSGPLSAVLTHLRVVEETNPYSGEGLSIISYASESGSGEGWTYGQLLSPGRVELKGLFTSPLFGIVSATLDESKTPRTLFMSIERVDLGLPPAADLNVQVWGPGRVSPGQTIDHIIEYRNDGLKAAEDVVVMMKLPPEVEHISNTSGGYYNRESHEVVWRLGALPPNSHGYTSSRSMLAWGLPQGTIIDVIASIPYEVNEFPVDSTVGYEILETTEEPVRMNARVFDQFQSGTISMNATVTSVPDPIEPTLNYLETSDGVEIAWRFTVETHSYDQLEIASEYLKPVGEVLEKAKETYDINKAKNEYQQWLNWLNEKNLVSSESYAEQTKLNRSKPYTGVIPWLLAKIPIPFFNKVLEGYFNIGRQITYSGAEAILANEVRLNLAVACAGGSLQGDICNANSYQDVYKFYLTGKSHDVGSTTSQVTVARDPNIKYGPEGYVQSGQALNYEVEFENEGEGIAFGVYITDVLDEDLDAATLTVNDGGTYNPSTRAITWMIGQVNPHEGGTVSFSVNLRGDAAPGTDVINYATVYFPSVPEVTRTNGVVCRVPVGGPPVADAGPDQVLECSSSGGAEVTLDATGSSDPDGDPLTFTWRKGGSIIAGPTRNPIAVLRLPVGQHAIELTVDDGLGGIDTDEAVIRVEDTTAPSAVALLIPQAGTEGIYKVQYKISDVCDSIPELLHLDINSISVSDGQLVLLRAGDEFKYRTINGMLEMQGNRLILRCTAQDASENIGIGETTPVVTARGKGFWAHQSSNGAGAQFDGAGTSEEMEDGVTYFTTIPKGADSGHSVVDSVHEPTQNLIVYLNAIRNEFDAFDWLVDEAVDEGNYERISKNVSALLTSTTKSMRLKAQCHVLALLLDLASNRLARNTVVSPDDLLLDALEYVFPVLADSSASKGDLERGKNIAEMISNGNLLADAELIPGGSLPALFVTGGTVSEIEERQVSTPLPTEFKVSQGYPNPFNPMATINYALPAEGKVTIEIYDIVGRKVVTLVDATGQAGYHSVIWQGRDTAGNSVASGVYFCRVQFGKALDVKKLMLLR